MTFMPSAPLTQVLAQGSRIIQPSGAWTLSAVEALGAKGCPADLPDGVLRPLAPATRTDAAALLAALLSAGH